MKPTKEQIRSALEAAERMHYRDLDPHHLARVLLYFNQRNAALEKLLGRADRLVRFGMAEGDLSALRRQVQRLREEGWEGEPDADADSSMLM